MLKKFIAIRSVGRFRNSVGTHIHALCVLAEAYPGDTLPAAIDDALRAQIPTAEHRGDMARLVAAWLRAPEGDPPPLSAGAVADIYRQLSKRAH